MKRLILLTAIALLIVGCGLGYGNYLVKVTSSKGNLCTGEIVKGKGFYYQDLKKRKVVRFFKDRAEEEKIIRGDYYYIVDESDIMPSLDEIDLDEGDYLINLKGSLRGAVKGRSSKMPQDLLDGLRASCFGEVIAGKGLSFPNLEVGQEVHFMEYNAKDKVTINGRLYYIFDEMKIE